MRRLIIAATMATLVAGGAGMALADPGDHGKAGPNGHNNYGLCNAYNRGSENGQTHKHNSTAFQSLEAAADAAGNGDMETTADEMTSFCEGVTPGGK